MVSFAPVAIFELHVVQPDVQARLTLRDYIVFTVFFFHLTLSGKGAINNPPLYKKCNNGIDLKFYDFS